jgi:hypothetical protein
MKAEAGWGAAALVAMALVGISSRQGGNTPETGAASSLAVGGQTGSTAPPDSFKDGPCGDLEDRLQAFFLAPKVQIAAPESCFPGPGPKNRDAAAGDLLKKANRLHFIIAIVPDPLHTHFSLTFDRLMESIQQGAQDEDYVYDSSWLPWDTQEQSFVLLADADKSDDRKKARESQPGVLLFRKNPSVQDTNAAVVPPDMDGLAVFVVGEEPTSGVHKRQFENAAQWIKKLQQRPPGGSSPPEHPVKILGPTFSGSLPSLADLLAEHEIDAGGKDLSIYSGGITSDAMVRWFVERATADVKAKFRSFQESDSVAIGRYRSYLENLGVPIFHLAIISEDETAFGSHDSLCEKDQYQDGSGPACLYYPRDISAVRDAYQKQSIFNAGSTRQTAESAGHSLPSDIADPEGKQHDTIRTYGGDQAPLSQEAVLQQIVSSLRAHESQYVLLRSSNAVDQLFLSHFLRLAYPEGRIVIQGSDLLMRRESGTASLSGIMTLTTYPLLPWENHWTTAPGKTSHSHRVFAQDVAEGTYVATRFLLGPRHDCGSSLENVDREHSIYFLPAACAHSPIRDYSRPFWPNGIKNPVPHRPVTWLSVLGRDGFWPVAALKEQQPEPDWVDRLWSSLHSLWKIAVWTVLIGSDSAAEAPTPPGWPDVPMSMKVCLLVVFLWSLFHLYCCALPSLSMKLGYRAHFVRVQGKSHPALVVFGSVMVSFVPILLGCGYGAMSPTGEPVAHAWWYRAFLPITWLIAASAVCVNAWVASEDYRPSGSSAMTIPNRKSIWEASRWPLLCYFASTFLLFLLIAFVLEGSLGTANRIPTYWRSMSLTSGVSPLVPLLALAAGLYCWFWYSLQGLGLFGDDRPQLPTIEDLEIAAGDSKKLHSLRMFSEEEAARPIEALSDPLAKQILAFAGALLLALSVVSVFVAGSPPLRSLGSRDYSILFCIGLSICVSLMLASAWQLLSVWLRLRQLLVFLDRTPLRRTMYVLKGYSWGTVWKMGGNVLDQYKLLSRQLECLTHLRNSWPRGDQSGTEPVWHTQIGLTEAPTAAFVEWYSTNWANWKVRDRTKLREVQLSIALTVGRLLANTLIREWKKEKESLILDPAVEKGGAAEPSKDIGQAAIPRQPDYVRSAEELVCLTYLGFIQNVLGRLRTLVMAIVWLFVVVTVSLASYPFDPRPVASGAMLILFLVLGAVIVTVYAQMHRDATLSHVTNTNPGELGPEFWFKVIGFGAGPVLGLLANIFPELTGSLLSWLQPGLASIK